MVISGGSIPFAETRGSGPQQASTDVAMPAAVTTATALLTGMNVSYSNNDDHHLGNLTIQLDAAITAPTTVRVTATYGLRDWSGTWDDAYEGEVFFTVVGE